MNPHLQQLNPYPFARLREAMQGITPPAHLREIPLYIGEPKHPTPPNHQRRPHSITRRIIQIPRIARAA